MDSDDDLPPLEIVGTRRVQTDRATAADVPPEPATDADVPLALPLLRRFLVEQTRAMVAKAVIVATPVYSAKGSKSALRLNMSSAVAATPTAQSCNRSRSGALLHGWR